MNISEVEKKINNVIDNLPTRVGETPRHILISAIRTSFTELLEDVRGKIETILKEAEK